MAKKLLSIEVRGHRKRWGFTFIGDPKHLPDWRAARPHQAPALSKICEIEIVKYERQE